ncbi:MAG: thiamine-monophosphate kinase [Candidatus Kentron sp. G]|nr:MAG: thiamine-monophosphate kinase [Candidatus Kentron sp. G]VFN06401.1 MAG: thiamine-monophosphate kinase [Candidatus Kentron sp. G]VFN08069.1 MAG: thiamine-monophosphate kinase [Candidatus Kentron sp. G]
MHEFELIGHFFSDGTAKREDVVLGIGDDAALLRVGTGQAIVTAINTVRDPMQKQSPEFLGRHALALSLHRLRDKQATPAWATLALTLHEIDENWLTRFSHGIKELARDSGVSLIGGDTTRGPLSITVIANGLRDSNAALLPVP